MSVSFAGAVFIIEWVLRLFLAAVIVMRRRATQTTLAWLTVIAFVPFVGLVAYVFVGESRLGSRRIRRRDNIARLLEAEGVAIWHHRHQDWEPRDILGRHVASHGTAVSGLPPLRGNRVKLMGTAEEVLAHLARDIDDARSHVHILSYIWQPTGYSQVVAQALVRAAERGVECRVLVDAVGSKLFLRSETAGRLRQAGVRVEAALPVGPVRMLFSRIDLRNHRKIAVIDGRIGYTGSQNISDSGFRSKPRRKTGPWIDATARVEGPAAQALALVFLHDWTVETDEDLPSVQPYLPPVEADPEGSVIQVLPSGPGVTPHAIHQAMLTMIYMASEEIIITTPYFVPDDATRLALQAAARRGVSVTIVLPEVLDAPLVAAAARAHILDLLEAGVTIRLFKGGLLHAKTVTIDRRLGVIGSANVDMRSFWLNFEITMILYDDDVASVLRFLQTAYMGRARAITLEEWRRRGLWRTALDNVAQLLGPLL